MTAHPFLYRTYSEDVWHNCDCIPLTFPGNLALLVELLMSVSIEYIFEYCSMIFRTHQLTSEVNAHHMWKRFYFAESFDEPGRNGAFEMHLHSAPLFCWYAFPNFCT